MVLLFGFARHQSLLAVAASLLRTSCRTTDSCSLDAIAAHKLDQNDARAAPRGLHKAAGPLPGHNTNNTKTLGPAGATHDDKPAARLLGGGRRLDGHGQDRECGRDADENRAQVPQGSKVL